MATDEQPFELNYNMIARTLADTLTAYARDRHPDDQKEIARLQTELCRMRREEIEKAAGQES